MTSAKSVWHWVMQNVGGVSCSPWRLTHDTRHICTLAATNRREGQQLATSSNKHVRTRRTQGTAHDVINLYLYQASQNASESFRILWNVPEKLAIPSPPAARTWQNLVEMERTFQIPWHMLGLAAGTGQNMLETSGNGQNNLVYSSFFPTTNIYFLS